MEDDKSLSRKRLIIELSVFNVNARLTHCRQVTIRVMDARPLTNYSTELDKPPMFRISLIVNCLELD